jgi:hypothetical protein
VNGLAGEAVALATDWAAEDVDVVGLDDGPARAVGRLAVERVGHRLFGQPHRTLQMFLVQFGAHQLFTEIYICVKHRYNSSLVIQTSIQYNLIKFQSTIREHTSSQVYQLQLHTTGEL